MDHTTTTKTGVATVAALFTSLFGAADMWMTALITAIVVDYLTGLSKAYILGDLSSRVGFNGIVRKVMYFAIVAVAQIADNLSGASGSVRSTVIGFLIANEGISVLENCAAANLPVPSYLLKVLNRIKGSDEEAS